MDLSAADRRKQRDNIVCLEHFYQWHNFMVHGDKTGLFIDGDIGIFLDYVINGIIDRCFIGNRHFNAIGFGNNAVHTKKLDCDV